MYLKFGHNVNLPNTRAHKTVVISIFKVVYIYKYQTENDTEIFFTKITKLFIPLE